MVKPSARRHWPWTLFSGACRRRLGMTFQGWKASSCQRYAPRSRFTIELFFLGVHFGCSFWLFILTIVSYPPPSGADRRHEHSHGGGGMAARHVHSGAAEAFVEFFETCCRHTCVFFRIFSTNRIASLRQDVYLPEPPCCASQEQAMLLPAPAGRSEAAPPGVQPRSARSLRPALRHGAAYSLITSGRSTARLKHELLEGADAHEAAPA